MNSGKAAPIRTGALPDEGRAHASGLQGRNAVDVVSKAMVATTVTFADQSYPQSAPVTLSLAAASLGLAGSETAIEEAVMDKGHDDNRLLARLSSKACALIACAQWSKGWVHLKSQQAKGV